MKLTLALATSMAASALASPFYNKDWSKDWKQGWNKGKEIGKCNLPSHLPSNTQLTPPPPPPARTPFDFTSTFSILATPDQVVDSNNATTGGLPGAKGLYLFGLNSHQNTICYNITLYDFQGEYQSPALTATHIHQAAKGKAGPPRIAFPDPQPIGANGEVRRSVGCLTGPFRTGLPAGGPDSGEGFQVRQIEEDPKGFFADVHSSLAVAGAVRGQFA